MRWIGLLLLLGISFFFALSVGSSTLDPRVLFDPSNSVLAIRLPRVCLAGITGASLGITGAALQALLRNPLADPYITGVSGGAALGGVLAIALNITGAYALPLSAFAGALLSIVFLLSIPSARRDPLVLLLCGIVFNAFASAIITLIKTIVSPTQSQEILFWLMGNIGLETWSTLLGLSIYTSLGCIILWLGAGSLNLLALGDEIAQSLGLPVPQTRMLLFSAAALLVGAIVSATGMIGFVGLIVPHIMRHFVGSEHSKLIPACLLGGASFLILADAVARAGIYFLGTEVPVGVVTAFTGGPFFLGLLVRKQKNPRNI